MGKYRLELFSYLGFSVGLYLNCNNLDTESKKTYFIEVNGEFTFTFLCARILSSLCYSDSSLLQFH